MRNHLEHRLPWTTLAELVKLKCVRNKARHEPRLSHKQLKSIFHFGRCLADAIREFAATNKASDAELRQYDPLTWSSSGVAVHTGRFWRNSRVGDGDGNDATGDRTDPRVGSHDADGNDDGYANDYADGYADGYDGYGDSDVDGDDDDDLSFETSLIEGYVELNLILADPKLFAPLLMSHELQRTDAMDAMCAERQCAHPLWLASRLAQAFDGDCMLPLTVDVLQILRDHCDELFRCMYSLGRGSTDGSNVVLDAVNGVQGCTLDALFLSETIAKRFGMYYDMCLWHQEHPETPLA